MDGNNASDCGEKDDEHSLTQWKFKMLIVENQVRHALENGEKS